MYNRTVRRLLVLACLPFVMGPAQPLPVRYSNIIICGLARAHLTPAELKRESDRVLHVRVNSQRSFDFQYAARVVRGSPGQEVWEDRLHTEVYTAHAASVLRVLKAGGRAVAKGSTQVILQQGGLIQRADHVLVETVNSQRPIPIRTEWVLFLRWSEHLNGFGFDPARGAIQIEDGRVTTRVGGLDPAWTGADVAELIAALSH